MSEDIFDAEDQVDGIMTNEQKTAGPARLGASASVLSTCVGWIVWPMCAKPSEVTLGGRLGACINFVVGSWRLVRRGAI